MERTGSHRFVETLSGTPTAGGCAGGTKPGTAVSFVGVDGAEIGKLAVDAVTDRFTGSAPNSPPPRGSRFSLLGVTVQNTGTPPWQFDPGAIAIQDGDGFILRPTNINYGANPPAPALAGQAIAPGATAKGVIAYAAVKGSHPARIIFIPGGERLLVLGDVS